MTKHIKSIILALVAVVVGFLAVPSVASASVKAAPVAPRVTVTGYTDCNQSAFLGTRVCYDDTTGYGPVTYVYTSAYGVYAAEGSFNGCSASSSPAFAATPWEVQVSGDQVTVPYYLYSFHRTGGAPPVPCNGYFFEHSESFHNLLEWILANPYNGYEVVHAK